MHQVSLKYPVANHCVPLSVPCNPVFGFQVRSSPDKVDKGMAPIYGAAGKMPDRGTVGDLLVAYMDAAC